MSLSGKYTTTDSIIERINRTGINDFTEEEAKEWIWEVVGLMGVPRFYIDKIATLVVENARATLPYDLHDITEGGVREYYKKIPLLKELNTFYNPDAISENANQPILFSTEAPSIVYVDGVQVDDTEAFFQNIPASYYNIESESYTYKINNGFIYTGFKEGLIEVAYKAFPVDNDNKPMVEDNIKVIRAVESYIKKMVITRMWYRDEASDKKLQKAERDYSFAIASARSDASIGSVEDWEAIRARMNRLYRDPNLHRIGYQGYSSREGINLNGLR